MYNWTQFIQSRHGSQLIRFFQKLNAEISEVTQNPDKYDGVLLLNTKKGYWLYKIFDREESVQTIQVYSDRYAQKLTDYSCLEGKLIYLVDDTLLHGNGLFDTYKLLAEHISDVQFICPIVFALHEDIDPNEKAKQTDNELKQKFWNSLKYYIRMTDEEIGEFCISVTNLLHSCGIPYVIDLPYLKDDRLTDCTTNYEVVLTDEQFHKLQEDTSLWKFQQNSFHVHEVNFLQGFIIHMNDEPLLSAVRDCFVDFAITGTYTEDENANKHIVFVPFAMAKSITKKRLTILWHLFAETIDVLPDYELPDDNTPDVNAKPIWIRSFRECIYLLSMVIAERFKNHLKSLTDISLHYDNAIIKEHFQGDFINRAKSLEKKLNADPDFIYQKLLHLSDSITTHTEMNHFTTMNHSVTNIENKEEYKEETAYNIILSEIQKQRIHVLKNESLILLEADDIHRLLTERFYFPNKTDERFAQSNIIAAFLHSSVFGSRLNVSQDGKKIIKGFRYGENSDLALPFLNLGFYWAIVLMNDHIDKKKLQNFYDCFVLSLKEQFQKMSLLGDYITKDNFEVNNQYFKNIIMNNLHLYNKAFYFKPYYNGDMPKSEVVIMHKIEDFVANTQIKGLN